MASHALVPVSGTEGRSIAWSRDFAVVGAVTGVAAPLAVLGPMSLDSGLGLYLGAAGLAGLVSGAALGWATPRLLNWRLHRWPRAALVPAGALLGAAWGGLVGAAAGLTSGSAFLAGASALVAAGAGALQLGWFWLAYTHRRVRRRPAGRVVALACVAAPLLGWASLLAFFTH